MYVSKLNPFKSLHDVEKVDLHQHLTTHEKNSMASTSYGWICYFILQKIFTKCLFYDIISV